MQDTETLPPPVPSASFWPPRLPRVIEKRYSFTQPPPSVEEARRRMEELEDGIVKIQTDLSIKEPGDEFVKGDYDAWRVSATRSMHYKEYEKLFLITWIDRKEGVISEDQFSPALLEKTEILKRMITQFTATAPFYSPVFTPESLPKNHSEARARRNEVQHISTTYQMFLRDLKARADRIHFPDQDLRMLRLDISETLRLMEHEQRLIKDTVRGFALENLSSASPPPGFVPTPRPAITDIGTLTAIQDIEFAMHDVRQTIGLKSAEMTEWLLAIVRSNATLIKLDEGQKQRLDGITTYLELLKKLKVLVSGSR